MYTRKVDVYDKKLGFSFVAKTEIIVPVIKFPVPMNLTFLWLMSCRRFLKKSTYKYEEKCNLVKKNLDPWTPSFFLKGIKPI